MSISGRCHCGRNAFEIAGELPDKLTRCTCSLCSKRGHLYAYYSPDQFKVVLGGKWDGTTRKIAVNARLLDNFEAADYPVTVVDGKHLW
jgi:hypothetical protein